MVRRFSGAAVVVDRPTWRRGSLSGLAGALVATLVVSGLAVATPAAAQTQAKPATQAKSAKPIAEAGNTAAAVKAAVAQKSPVAVADLTTETREVHAQPDGTLKAELSPRAVRAKQGKSWVDVDTTMVRRADGTVGPKVATVELSLSGGGAKAPLVRFGKNGKRISLSWPGTLPEPTLEGSIATYAEVLPGVDLAVRAEPDGYVEHLVIKTAQAAKNPALAKIRLGMSTEGVQLKNKVNGGLDATDAKGTVVFTAPAAAMWDAKDAAKTPAPKAPAGKAPAGKTPAGKTPAGKNPAATDPAATDTSAKTAKQLSAPGLGSRRATAKILLEKQALTVVPDQALLTNPATTYPVVVDPDWHTPGRDRLGEGLLRLRGRRVLEWRLRRRRGQVGSVLPVGRVQRDRRGLDVLPVRHRFPRRQADPQRHAEHHCHPQPVLR